MFIDIKKESGIYIKDMDGIKKDFDSFKLNINKVEVISFSENTIEDPNTIRKERSMFQVPTDEDENQNISKNINVKIINFGRRSQINNEGFELIFTDKVIDEYARIKSILDTETQF